MDVDVDVDDPCHSVGRPRMRALRAMMSCKVTNMAWPARTVLPPFTHVLHTLVSSTTRSIHLNSRSVFDFFAT